MLQHYNSNPKRRRKSQQKSQQKKIKRKENQKLKVLEDQCLVLTHLQKRNLKQTKK